ncbi:hypothetical protein NW762_000279 [Fusarium torreyae]|uniref:Nephrocystin 3-like N-terminal domain-containing protein n=1 Tax=Fusarium torreyae TaxID=1237075 RepID=A0A9W8SIZ0_9HYPO|nr:hypothetical protein NW762_000279 [Fusarium torreyae]
MILSVLEGHEQTITAALDTASIVWVDETERYDILQSLSPSTFQLRHQDIQASRDSDTCDWLLRHKTFRGAGKTVTTSRVIDHFQPTPTGSSTIQGLAFFYCRFDDDEEKREAIFTLRSYVRQLSAANRNPNYMRKELRDLYTRERLLEGRLTLDSCKVQLLESVNLFPQTILILEGIDEYKPEEYRQIIDTMEFLLLNSKRALKIFISGWDGVASYQRFPVIYYITIGARATEEDLREFINAEINKHETWDETSSSVREYLVNALVDRSFGMFRWAYLQVKQLLEAKSGKDNATMLWTTPKLVSDIHDGIFHKIRTRNKQDQAHAERTFMWIMCACAPPTSDELLSAIRLDPKSNTEFLSDKVTERQLLDICSGCLRLDPQYEVWRFGHFLIEEYFATNHWNLQEAHCHTAKVCLKLLIEADKTFDHSGQSSDGYHEEESGKLHILNPAHPIQVYARHHWIVHLQALEGNGADPELGALLKSFLGSPMKSSLQYQQWYIQVVLDHAKSLPPTSIFRSANVREISPKDTPILAMCRFSFYETLIDWWGKADTVLSQTNHLGDSLLALAAQAGCRPICELLVQRGVDVNDKGGSAGSALTAAVLNGNTEVVEFFIEQGADVAASLQSLDSVKDRNSLKQLALDYAVVAGDLDMLNFLITQGVNVNHTAKSDLRTPLHLAAELGRLETVALLLDANADPTREDELSRTALDFARRSGSGLTVLLFEKAIKLHGRVLVLGLCFKAKNDETTLRSVTITRTMNDYALFDSIFRKYEHNRRREWRRYSPRGLQHVVPVEYQRFGNSTVITERHQPQDHLLARGQNQLCSRIKARPKQSKNEKVWVEAFVQELSSRPDPEDSGFGLECLEGWVMKRIIILAILCIAGAGLIGILWATILDKTADGFAITGCLIAAEALDVALMVFEAQIRQATR